MKNYFAGFRVAAGDCRRSPWPCCPKQQGRGARQAGPAYTPIHGRGFTYTEVLITLAVLAALFVPMMQLFSHTLASSSVTGDMIAALNLGKWQMERVKNLDYGTEQFKKIGSTYLPPLEEPPLELNGRKWRIYTEIDTGSDPLKVKVSVFPDGRLKDKPTVELVTLLEDMTWIKAKPGMSR